MPASVWTTTMPYSCVLCRPRALRNGWRGTATGIASMAAIFTSSSSAAPALPLDGAGGDALDDEALGQDVEHQHRERGQRRAGHQLAPEEDVVDDQVRERDR